jgi:hypothetical protein
MRYIFSLWAALATSLLAQPQNPLALTVVPGSDFCTQINTLAGAGNADIYIQTAGSYAASTTCVLPANVQIHGALAGFNVYVKYNGTGQFMTMAGQDDVSGINLTLGSSATDGFVLKGTNNTLHDFFVTGGSTTTNAVHITATSESTLSGTQRVYNATGSGINGNAIKVDHSIDTFLHDISFSGTAVISGYGLLVDTGVSGVYGTDISFESFGKGILFQSTTTGGGTYKQIPNFFFFQDLIVDCGGTCGLSDGINFASTLSTQVEYATFSNTWEAGYGRNGVHISGGKGISFTAASKIRANGLSGVLIDNANVSDVLLNGNFIQGNNTSDTASIDGVDVIANVSHVSIANNHIGGSVEASGHTAYGVFFGPFLADEAEITDNDLSGNARGGLLFNANGNRTIFGNTSLGDAIPAELPGALKSASLLATGIMDGKAPVTITTGATATLGGTYNSGYIFNDGSTAVSYTLPTAAAGKQYCISDINGSGRVTLKTAATGQYILIPPTAGLTTSGGFVTSSGSNGDSACVVGISATQWVLHIQSGTWAAH